MTKRVYCNLRLLRVYFETSGSVHGRCGTSISEKVKLSEKILAENPNRLREPPR